MTQVAFPGLGWSFALNRVAFTVLGKEIYWYAIIIASGFLLAVWYTTRRTKEFGLAENDFIDMLLYATPVAILFARAYYVIFNFENYRNNLTHIFYIWEGGIAIYGAIIGSVLVVLLFCKKRKVSPLDMLDLGALGLLIGQAIGRWGNFVNGEAFGGATSLPWRMELFDPSMMSVVTAHPTFFYESIWNVIGFVLLHFCSKKRKFSGEIFLLYAAWYGLGRGFIEGLRTDSLYWMGTGIRVSQVVGFASVFVAGAILVIQWVRIKRKG